MPPLYVRVMVVFVGTLFKEEARYEFQRLSTFSVAHVAKCLLSMHIVANVAHKIGRPESMHRIKTFLV